MIIPRPKWLASVALGTLVAASTLAAPKPREAKFVVSASGRHGVVSTQPMRSVGGRLLALYGEAHFVAIPEKLRDVFIERANAASLDVRELDDIIHTPRRAIDPNVDGVTDAWPNAGLFVIQYAAPPTPEWQTQVTATGVVTLLSIPERANIVLAA